MAPLNTATARVVDPVLSGIAQVHPRLRAAGWVGSPRRSPLIGGPLAGAGRIGMCCDDGRGRRPRLADVSRAGNRDTDMHQGSGPGSGHRSGSDDHIVDRQGAGVARGRHGSIVTLDGEGAAGLPVDPCAVFDRLCNGRQDGKRCGIALHPPYRHHLLPPHELGNGGSATG